jgi:hypothetical protein
MSLYAYSVAIKQNMFIKMTSWILTTDPATPKVNETNLMSIKKYQVDGVFGTVVGNYGYATNFTKETEKYFIDPDTLTFLIEVSVSYDCIEECPQLLNKNDLFVTSKICDYFASLYNKDLLSDVTLKVSKVEIPAHRIVLSGIKFFMLSGT